MSEPSTATFGGGPPPPSGQISGQYKTFITVASVFTAVSTVCVSIRFWSRSLTKVKGLDDWSSLGALIFSFGFLATTVTVALMGGAGYHISEVTGVQMEHYGQIDLANNVIYNCSIALSKYAVLILYLRIFSVKPFKIATYIVMAVVAAFWCSSVFGLIFAYDPVESQWKYWLPHTSINNKAFWLASAIINICIDFTIICMPQPLVWKLQLSVKRKILLTLLFALGFFTCICSIVRCVYLSEINFADPTYSVSIAGIWTNIELNMSIICSCGPSFPRVVEHIRGSKDRSLFSFSFNRSGASWRSRLLGSKASGATGSHASDASSLPTQEKISIGSMPSSHDGHEEWPVRSETPHTHL